MPGRKRGDYSARSSHGCGRSSAMTDNPSSGFERRFERRVARYAAIDPATPDAAAVAHEVMAGRRRFGFTRFRLAPYGSPAARLAVATLLLLGALVAIW